MFPEETREKMPGPLTVCDEKAARVCFIFSRASLLAPFTEGKGCRRYWSPGCRIILLKEIEHCVAFRAN